MKWSDSTKKLRQRSHLPLHLGQPCLSESLSLIFGGRARISLIFLGLLNDGMIDPLGNIFETSTAN